ncbi:Sgf29p Ecym_1303 [Eremothecium cymbalariae DBVPG|uniref:SGF29 C-terminal domain-containing protein n=1 Tax=Eremothecium cymbalariae (strain CBS 270.75 / DBVPG 7215 / KCTC 17166 / NRRL Y-17582) TaxID=931890 RepID=G8JN77_ERECY|nr:hypothetical protein Ecym_1303 [Eremothecium cymbalariae DBVPG\
MDGQWDVIVSSLQDIFNIHDASAFEDDVNAKRVNFNNMTLEQLQEQLLRFQEHRDNVLNGRRLIGTMQENLDTVIKLFSANHEASGSQNSMESVRVGRSYWTSNLNPNEPIYVGSEVAYKPKRTGAEAEWFQCEVTKISADGTKFEVRDPEPDEFGQPGGVFKCNWKEILLIPPSNSTRQQIPNYPSSTKVLARYPETTTFYPAMVIGNKRDGTCRLRFDGEEEVDKETEVDRRYVLPFPAARRP